MFKQYMYSKHTIDIIILQNQRPVAVHNTDFTSTKQFNLQNKEQTHLPNLGAPTDFANFRGGGRTPCDPRPWIRQCYLIKEQGIKRTVIDNVQRNN